jgi:hypothetical protein
MVTNEFDETEDPASARQNLRPFYFVVVFWGERFRNYLVDFCLPSLLSPNNIPVLAGERGHKFIFCTTSEDWRVLTETKIFGFLKECVEPYHIEIPAAPTGRTGCEHMGIGHKLASQMAYRDKVYAVYITPDLMVSDGTVKALRKHAVSGYKVVLTAALRFGEEPLFENLKAAGAISEGSRLSELGRPLTITGRQLVSAALRSFHSETQRYEWDAPYFANFPAACWWRVAGEDGIVLHSLSWAPFLCDYAAVQTHDTRALDTWTMDGDYVHRNFGDGEDVYVVTDSDEIMLVSWAPLSDRPESLAPNSIKGSRMGEIIKGGILRAAVLSGVFDRLKQRILFTPVRWHAHEFGTAWEASESRAASVLHRYLWDLEPGDSSYNGLKKQDTQVGGRQDRKLKKRYLGPAATLGRIWIVIAVIYRYRERVRQRLSKAIRGDREALDRIIRRTGMFWRLIRGARMG